MYSEIGDFYTWAFTSIMLEYLLFSERIIKFGGAARSSKNSSVGLRNSYLLGDLELNMISVPSINKFQICFSKY